VPPLLPLPPQDSTLYPPRAVILDFDSAFSQQPPRLEKTAALHLEFAAQASKQALSDVPLIVFRLPLLISFPAATVYPPAHLPTQSHTSLRPRSTCAMRLLLAMAMEQRYLRVRDTLLPLGAHADSQDIAETLAA
jgi:hypothetical protein